MKILKGRLTETIYAWPCQDPANLTLCATASDSTEHTCSHRRSDSSSSSDGSRPTELNVNKETVYTADQVTYMSDRIGLHRIRNPSEYEFAVSLHLYTVSSLVRWRDGKSY
jgi:cysteine dioxygenase